MARVKVDVTEKNGAYLVHSELPGVKKEDVQLTIDGAQAKFADGVLELTLPKKAAAARKQITIQ